MTLISIDNVPQQLSSNSQQSIMSWLYMKYTGFEAWNNLCVNVRIRSRSKPPHVDLSNKTIIITGATSGIGRETAIRLARLGANLILGCRNTEAAETLKAEILQTSNKVTVKVYKLDLMDYQSIRSFVHSVQHEDPVIDVLINNAGAICHDAVDGHDQSLRVNYLGHVMLSLLLMHHMRRGCESVPRILNLGTIGHMNIQEMDLKYMRSERIQRPLLSYAYAKAALLMFTMELNERMGGKVKVVAVDPGVSLTPGYRTMFTHPIAKWMSEGPLTAPWRRSVSEAADSLLFALVDQSSHVYLCDGNPQVMSPVCHDPHARLALWNMTRDILDLPVMDSLTSNSGE